MGCCALAHPDVAQYVQDALLHFHGERYTLHAWCIMPNHVHVLIEPLLDLATIVQGWKSYTARWVLGKNAQLGLKIPRPDQLWMREYWDRYIRDADHYQTTVEYIHQNPVEARLCRGAESWPWSSAFSRHGVLGNADGDVGIGIKSADEDVGVPRADGDVGAPRADGDVGAPRADGDVGDPRNDGDVGDPRGNEGVGDLRAGDKEFQ